MTASLLEITRLTKAFDSLVAVDDVSFSVGRGELVALIGPNGAGKSTCFNLINGQLEPDRGSILLDGKRIDGLPPRRIAKLNVGRTFQFASSFASMTARENVALAIAAAEGKEAALDRYSLRSWYAGADRLLARIGAGDLGDAHCAALAYGDVKRVELALALAGSPRLLLMDEPTSGMTLADRRNMMQRVAPLAHDDGVAILFTEHDMDVVFDWADRVLVLDLGRLIAQGPPTEIRADPRVREAYLGDLP